jgi:hypothetical protein
MAQVEKKINQMVQICYTIFLIASCHTKSMTDKRI